MAMPAQESRPDAPAIAGFGALVVMGGLNFPAVKATVEHLAPVWSAGIRFAAAALILVVIVLVRGEPLPRGRSLTGTLLFGVLSFAGAYTFAYWGIERLPAGVASIVMASVPLITFVATVAHRLEAFRWQTLAGALLALVGIAIMVGGAGTGSVSFPGVAATVLAAICIAEAAVVAKRFPPVPPLVMNAVGMTFGAVILLAVSFVAGEPHVAPAGAPTWIGLAYLVVIGSIVLFVTYLFVLRRWTASGTSYMFVLFPVVAVLFASLFQGERITAGLVAGGALVIAGVYVGALLRLHGRAARAPRGARPELAGVPAECVRCP